MMRLMSPLILIILSSCATSEYRFERVEDSQSIVLPLKFDSLQGGRDGSSVNAVMRFSDGQDSAEITLALYLKPPAECTSGSFRAVIAGRTTTGVVDCASLTYLGGQASSPSIGGVFILKDPQGRPAYRVSMPATPLQRRLGS
jgi:hypothetical protein